MTTRKWLGMASLAVLGIALFWLPYPDTSALGTPSFGLALFFGLWVASSAAVKVQMVLRFSDLKLTALALGAAITAHWWTAYVEHRHQVLVGISPLESAVGFLFIFGWPLVDVANILLLSESKGDHGRR